MRGNTLIVVSVLGPSVVACNAIFGIADLSYDPESTPTASPAGVDTSAGGQAGYGAAGGAGGHGGATSCLPGYVCRPSHPDALYLGWPEDGACAPGSTPTTFAQCSDCSCSVKSNGSCHATVELHDDAACSEADLTREGSGNQGSCFDVTFTAAQGVRAVAHTEATPGGCEPDESSVASSPLDACISTPSQTCPNGVCLPVEATCMVLPATTTCPSPYETTATVYLDNDVACSCACDATGSCTSSNLWVYPQEACDGGQELNEGSCQATGMTAVQSIWIHPGTEQTQCAASGIAATAPHTLCCVPVDR